MTQIPEADSLRQANLRYLLNQWDPIGVADLVDDEYDCLLAPQWRCSPKVSRGQPCRSTSGSNSKTTSALIPRAAARMPLPTGSSSLGASWERPDASGGTRA